MNRFTLIHKVVMSIVALFLMYYVVLIVAAYSLKVPDLVWLTPEQAVQKESQEGVLVGYDETFNRIPLSPGNLILKEGIPIFATSDILPDSMWVPVQCSLNTKCPQYYFLDLLPDEQTSYDDGYPDDFNASLLAELQAGGGGHKIYNFQGIYFSVPSSSPQISVKAFGLTGDKPTGPRFSQVSYPKFQDILKEYRIYFDKDRRSFSRREERMREIYNIP